MSSGKNCGCRKCRSVDVEIIYTKPDKCKQDNKCERGPRGPRGCPGVAGTPGTPGAAGAAGATGMRGAQGIQGVPGTKGDQGLQGISSPPNYQEFGYVYDNAISQVVESGAAVVFATNSPTSLGVIHAPGATSVKITVQGTYSARFIVNQLMGAGSSYALQLNAAVIPGSQVTSWADQVQLSGQCTFTVSALGGTLTLNNVGHISSTLNGTPPNGPNANLFVNQITTP